MDRQFNRPTKYKQKNLLEKKAEGQTHKHGEKNH